MRSGERMSMVRLAEARRPRGDRHLHRAYRPEPVVARNRRAKYAETLYIISSGVRASRGLKAPNLARICPSMS